MVALGCSAANTVPAVRMNARTRATHKSFFVMFLLLLSFKGKFAPAATGRAGYLHP